MNSLLTFKTEQDDFQVQYEIISPVASSVIANPYQLDIAQKLESIDAQLEICEQKVAELNKEIDRLTNHADGLDYTIAVASGVLTGLIDSFFVGDYNPNIEEIVTQFASRKAKKKGETISNYKEAREWLEKSAHVDHDGAYKKTPIFNKDTTAPNGHTHRLDDLAHHPTLLGLAASIFFQFFRIALFVNKDGKIRPVFVEQNAKEMAKVWMPVVLSGVFLWLANVAENYVEKKLDDEIPEPIKKLIKCIAATPVLIRVLKCADTWFSHIMSDVGPKTDGAAGKGIPGIFLSLLKEISAIIPSPRLHAAIQLMYKNGTMNFDNELVIIEKMKKQAIPVIINEVIVRGFYFVRRLIAEYNNCHNLVDIEWQNVIPFGNRTVERMMTIATGTFTAVDMADAAIRSGGFNAACLLRVNFVGVGRFAIAIVTDVGMGIKKGKLQKEKYAVIGEQLDLLNVKVSYLYASAEYAISEAMDEQSQLWLEAEDTVSTLMEVNDCIVQAVDFYQESLQDISASMKRIGTYVSAVEDQNPGLTQEMLDTIRFGETSWKQN